MSQVEDFVKEVASLQDAESKVLIVAGKPGSGKSKVLREAADIKGWDYVDCRLLITEGFLELLPAERQKKAPAIMREILASYNSDVILLDRVQTFFVPVLHIDVETLLHELGKSFTLVVAWPGYVDNDILCYDKFDGTASIRVKSEGMKIWNVEC
ncbi:MAG: BREX-3 system P-loop-containing protein BrxF [Acidaminococcaceae bacterium]|nr:BREX-3 system P-loop-containing protein BrxF [Acidaminococcaceae bacterium]MDD4721856.1 BREX-3 system P-loop-containing protein BrxF [Acidaminococcaceae bacterium]